jgi:hypothetical protein
MLSLIMRAYDVELDQIIGPSWIMDNMGPNRLTFSWRCGGNSA